MAGERQSPYMHRVWPGLTFSPQAPRPALPAALGHTMARVVCDVSSLCLPFANLIHSCSESFSMLFKSCRNLGLQITAATHVLFHMHMTSVKGLGLQSRYVWDRRSPQAYGLLFLLYRAWPGIFLSPQAARPALPATLGHTVARAVCACVFLL
jgi:hypothetical protein